MPFDPQRGADHARGYATKYASKPEIVGGINCLPVSRYLLTSIALPCIRRKWYLLETSKNGLKDWLKSRTSDGKY